jgi:hypothetical protein
MNPVPQITVRARARQCAVGEVHRRAVGVHRARRKAQSVRGSGAIEVGLEVTAGSERPWEPSDESGEA